jgi:uncharacterized protein YybS (DUF2232 family)
MALEMIVSFLSTLLMFGVAGMAVAWALLKGLKPRTVLGVGVLALSLYLVCGFLLDVSSTKEKDQLFTTIQQSFDKMWTAESQALQDEKVPQDQIDQAKAFYEKYVLWCSPAWSMLICLAIGLLAYYAVSSVLCRITQKVSPPIPFQDWTVPDYLVFGLIIGGVIKVIPFKNEWVGTVGNNLLVFFLGLYALEGFSLVSYFFSKFRLSRALKVLSIVTLVGYLFCYREVFFTVSAIGVLDVWFNFRKWKSPPPEVAE